jgi:anti-sigma B factor antagonist
MDRQGSLELQHQAVRDHPDAVLVTVDGSIDPKTVNQFKAKLQALTSRRLRCLVLECAKLTYINSSGLAYLLNVVGSLKEIGGTVAMVAVKSDIVLIFDMMGITGLFQFYPSTDDLLREMDEELQRESHDVGPALPLQEEVPEDPPPAPERTDPAPSTRRLRATERRTRPIPVVPAPSRNPIVRFFRGLFGLDDPPTARRVRVRRRRRS